MIRRLLRKYGLDGSPFALFSFLWAFQMIEEKSDRFVFDFVTNYPLLLAAVVLLILPRSAGVFVAFCGLQIVNGLEEMPFTVNHNVLITLINVGFLAHLARALWKRRRDDPERPRSEPLDLDGMFVSFGPAIRWMVGGVYVWAAFHKLNSGFFDPVATCFRETYLRLDELIPLLPTLGPTAVQASVVGVVALELALPFLLYIPRTRVAGLIVGLLFHLFLGLRHPSFSTLSFALYFVFIPPEAIEHLRLRARETKVWDRLRVVLPAGGIVAAFGLWYFSPLYIENEAALSTFRHVSWFVLAAATFGVCAWVLRTVPPSALLAPLPWRLSPGHVALVVLLSLNALSPYMGTKTTTAFSMYANLRTEGTSNHFLVPKGAIQWVHHQDELVEVIESNLPWHDGLDGAGWRTPLVQLRSDLAEARSSGIEPRLRYRPPGGGTTLTEEDLAATPAPSWLFRKFVHYRTVPPPGVNVCQW